MLKFKVADLLPLLIHSEQAAKRRKCYDIEGTDGPGLFFVKDHGVYLMSNGDPGLLRPDNKPGETNHLVVYAEGHDPNTNEDCWEDDRAECGGDDFGEFLAASDLRPGIEAGARWFNITMRRDTFALSFSK